jgi:hypothetical protein
MADKAKAVIEAMVWDLRSLEKKGMFGHEEIKRITKTREDQEYKMNKNTAKDIDYLNSIQYEMELVRTVLTEPGRTPEREVF